MAENKLNVSTGRPELGAPTLIINPTPATQEKPTEPVNKETDDVQGEKTGDQDQGV